jgi:hypothetical protein
MTKILNLIHFSVCATFKSRSYSPRVEIFFVEVARERMFKNGTDAYRCIHLSELYSVHGI